MKNANDLGAVNITLLTEFEESDLLHKAQENVRSWIIDSEQKVETLLRSNLTLLDDFAEEILKKESMHGEEINTVIDNLNN